jgi:hypothetical protein
MLAAKGGHNAENHNHNDVGHFVLYRDGEPFIVDIGVGTYTAQTFSPRRYELFYMRSSGHNIPVIDGVEQAVGKNYRASEVEFIEEGAERRLTMNLANAYPETPGFETIRRTLTLKAEGVELADRFAPESDATISLDLYTPATVEKSSNGLLLTNGKAKVELELSEGVPLTLHVETVPLKDERLTANWGDALTRIRLEGKINTETLGYSLYFR